MLVLALYNSAHASLTIRYRYAHSGRVRCDMQIGSAGRHAWRVGGGGVVVTGDDMIREQSNFSRAR
jgi:hypothetical protein